jgi:Ca2+-binding RTX toxin-like protein
MAIINGTSENNTLVGTTADDTIDGLEGHDLIIGLAGNDIIHGGSGDDAITGNAGSDTIYGEAGNDYLSGGAGDDLLDGGADQDVASYTQAPVGVTVDLRISTPQVTGWGTDTLLNIEDLFGSSHDDTLTGTDSSNIIWSFGGNDTINALGGNDLIMVAVGNHTIDGGAGTDTISYQDVPAGTNLTLDLKTMTGIENASGGGGDDVLDALPGGSLLAGAGGNDTLVGSSGDDGLYGDGYIGAFLIVHTTTDGDQFVTTGPFGVQDSGSSGADTLIGGGSGDVLYGGRGADRFVYTQVSDSAPGIGHEDIIYDFSGKVALGLNPKGNHMVHQPGEGDVIDLSQIDANTALPGDQAFTIVRSFDGTPGELLWHSDPSSSGLIGIYMDVNGDSVADMQIDLASNAVPTGADFIL